MSDVQLDVVEQDWVSITGAALYVGSTDVMLDDGNRRGGNPGYRRALVHDQGDALTVNYNDDYTGGLRLNDARIRLHVEYQKGTAPQLPRDGRTGELLAIRLSAPGDLAALQGATTSLWLCVGRGPLHTAPVSWVPLATGDTVQGTTS